MEIKGIIKKISETVQISDRFRKREFVVEYSSNPDYPQPLQFEMVQDRCELLDAFHEGQEIEVHFDLRGREWTNPQGEVKYFNSIQGWRIENMGQAAGNPEMPPMPPADAFEPATNLNTDENDDLPF